MRELDTAIQIGVPPMLLIAQTLPIPNSDLYMEAIRSLGVLVVLAWYLWYNTSVSQPRILDAAAKEREVSNQAHREEREALVKTARAESDQKRADFLAAISAQRNEFQVVMKVATDAFTSTIQKLSCKFDRDTHSKTD